MPPRAKFALGGIYYSVRLPLYGTKRERAGKILPVRCLKYNKKAKNLSFFAYIILSCIFCRFLPDLGIGGIGTRTFLLRRFFLRGLFVLLFRFLFFINHGIKTSERVGKPANSVD